MSRFQNTGILPTIGGFCALALAMGVGRFVYTALLPDMMTAYGLDEHAAGSIAAWNLVGYLAGVLLMRGEKPGARRYVLFAVSVALSLLTTIGMGLVQSLLAWTIMRALSGVASGSCFVLCTAIVLDTLAAVKRPVLAGFLFSGVGTGIALGGIAAPSLEAAFGLDNAWIGIGLFCLPLAVFALLFLRPGTNRFLPQAVGAANGAKQDNPAKRRTYLILLVAYFLEGFGYIIGTTFLVALVRETTHSAALASASWVVTGCAAAISAPLWRIAARRGYAGMLILAFVLQAVGVLLPALFTAPAAILAGGLLLGGTFMGITVLALQYGVSLSSSHSAHTVAVMTALYGVGQIIGPFVARLSAKGEGFGLSFIFSSLSLFLAAALLIAGELARNASRGRPSHPLS